MSAIALSICLLLTGYMLWEDRKSGGPLSPACWIPLVWFVISGSRFVSQWMDLRSPVVSADMDAEGSLIDRGLFLFLIVSGMIVLMRRRLHWGNLVANNRWLFLYFLFGAASVLWSDFPFVSIRRLVKAFGNVIMVLIVLTEERPYESAGAILRRFAVLLLPLSVIFIKYYPHLGRVFHLGRQMFTGVAEQKNGLGQLCLVSGIYFSWNVLLNLRSAGGIGRRRMSVTLIILPIVAWLFYMADSATSTVCMAIAFLLLLVGRHPSVERDPRRILEIGLAAVFLLGIAEITFGLSGAVLTMLGRRPDLTTRVPMWWDLLSTVKNPAVGFGYESFWLGFRRYYFFTQWGISSQAHNGYLQVYLDLGLIGLALMAGSILSGTRKVFGQLPVDYPVAMLRLCLIVTVAIYNWTEATFYGSSLMWSMLLLGIIDVPGRGHRAEIGEDVVKYNVPYGMKET